MKNIIHSIQQTDGTFILQLSTGVQFVPRSSIHFAAVSKLLPAPEDEVLAALEPINLPNGTFVVYRSKHNGFRVINYQDNSEPLHYYITQNEFKPAAPIDISELQLMSTHPSLDDIKHFYPELFI